MLFRAFFQLFDEPDFMFCEAVDEYAIICVMIRMPIGEKQGFRTLCIASGIRATRGSAKGFSTALLASYDRTSSMQVRSSVQLDGSADNVSLVEPVGQGNINDSIPHSSPPTGFALPIFLTVSSTNLAAWSLLVRPDANLRCFPDSAPPPRPMKNARIRRRRLWPCNHGKTASRHL